MKSSKLTNLFFVSLIFISMLFLSTSSIAEVAVIVNTGSGASELDKKTAKKLFLGKINAIPGMENITVVGQKDDSAVKPEFTKKITKKSLDKFKAYWSKRIFSGKSVPPKELGNDEEVKKFVANNINAIGYVDSAAVDNTVKVLLSVQ